MGKYTPVFVVLAVLILMVGALRFAMRPPSTAGEPTGGAPVAKKDFIPQKTSVEGAEMEQRDASGKLQWKVAADGELGFDKTRQIAQGKNVTFQLMQADKSPLVVKAPAFEANYNTRKLTFTRGVSGRLSDQSGGFSAAWLEYDFATGKLLGSGGASFSYKQYKATAQEIVVDSHDQKVRMRGDVRFGVAG